MSVEKFSWRSYSRNIIIQEADQLPQGLVENGTYSHRIFDGCDKKQQISTIRTNHNQDANDIREEVKKVVASQLKSYCASYQQDMAAGFESRITQKREDSQIYLKAILSSHFGTKENRARVETNKGEDCSKTINAYEKEELKKIVLYEVHQQLKSIDRMVAIELQRLKVQFEGELRNRFKALNHKMRAIEDSIHELRRVKLKALEEMKLGIITQAANVKDELLHDNVSAKIQTASYFSEKKPPRILTRRQNTPDRRAWTGSGDIIKQLERRITDSNHSIDSIRLKTDDQMIAFETATSGQMTLIHNEELNQKEATSRSEKSDQTERTVCPKETNELTKSVEFLKHFTTTYQEQMQALQDRPEQATTEKLQKPEPYPEPMVESIVLDVQPSAIANTSSCMRKNSSLGDLSKRIDNRFESMPRSRRIGSYTFLKGDSPRKQEVSEPMDSQVSQKHPLASLNNLVVETPTNPELSGQHETNQSLAVVGSDRKPETPQYYGDPKIKSLLDGHIRRRMNNTSESNSSIPQPTDRENDLYQDHEQNANLKASQNLSYLGKKTAHERIELNCFDSFGPTNTSEDQLLTAPDELPEYPTSTFANAQGFPLPKQKNTVHTGEFPRVQTLEERTTKSIFTNFEAEPLPIMSNFPVPSFGENLVEKNELKPNTPKETQSKSNLQLSLFSDRLEEFHDAVSHLSVADDQGFYSFVQDKADDNLENESFKSWPRESVANAEERAIQDKSSYYSLMNTLILSPKTLAVRDDSRENEISNACQNSKSKKQARTKQERFELIISQINYFLYGKISSLIEENEEISCNIDDNGYVFDEDGDFVTDQFGNKMKLKPEEITKFKSEEQTILILTLAIITIFL